MNPHRRLHASFDRRRLLRSGAAGGLSLNLWGLLRAQAAVEEAAGRAATAAIRSCIFVFYYGGPSHLDTFDMKPDAPSTVRGEFQPIATTAPGVSICEHLPHLSRVMHKAALVRSMHHTNRLHDSASTETFTGRQGPQGDREEFAAIGQFFPCHGAVLSYLQRDALRDVSHALLPWLFHNVVDVPCQGGGFLGSAYDPFQVAGDPASNGYRADVLSRPGDLSIERISRRRDLLGRLDPLESKSADRSIRQLHGFYDKAYELLESESLRRALDIKQETLQTRQRYGLHKAARHELRGQNLLMARRLVEAGVPFVNVHDFRQQGQNWDAHSRNFEQHSRQLLPPADQALSALIEDLDERGLLESTLVVATGEFGRTPKINANAGRDHWPDCYSLILAGGGIKGGVVYGASDRIGAYPAIDPVTPADLAATIYQRFGIDPRTEVRDQTGRPYRISDGRPMVELLS